MEEMKNEPQRSEHRNWVLILIVGIIIGSIVGGIFGTYLVFKAPSVFPWATASRQVVQISTGNYTTLPFEPSAIEGSVESVVEKVSPAVVRITSTQEVLDPFFLQIIPQEGLGSGVIISSDGLIITNNHVIENANKIEVTLSSGETYKGRIIGTDPVSDIAILKIDVQNLPFATFGDSSRLNVGQFVVAIGNPYGLDHTVTVGVISALERNIDLEDSTMYGVIQTDAAINPGNSGGPLVDLSGNVVGLNTMIYSGAQGLGFAVSSNTCVRVFESISKTGKMEWPYMGVQLTTMTEALATQQNIPYIPGVLVVRVVAGSPASRAGIRVNDVITSINGKGVKTADELVKEIRSYEVGDRVTLGIVRNNENINVDVVLGVQR